MFTKKSKFSLYFLLVTIGLYFSVYFFDKEKFFDISKFFYNLSLQIFPFLIMVFLLMFLLDYFVDPKKFIKYLNCGSKTKNWLIVILGGVLSSGPIYLWYPLLADLKKKGVRPAFLAAFLYNRAIKIPLLPLMAIYFSWRFIFLFSFLIIIFSIINGLLVEKFVKLNENYSDKKFYY